MPSGGQLADRTRPEVAARFATTLPACRPWGIAPREGAEKIYVGRMVSVITLAPDIVAAILDDTLLAHVTMFDLAADPPAP